MQKASSGFPRDRGFFFRSPSNRKKNGEVKSAFFLISMYGVNNEKDETNQKYIIQMNLISVVTFVINVFTGILFLFINEPWPALVCTIGATIWLLPIYFNRNGLNIFSRVTPVFLTAGTIFFASCWFSHNTQLDNYFLIVAINSTFVFLQRKEMADVQHFHMPGAFHY